MKLEKPTIDSIIRWAGRGYTAEDVSLIHDLSENTVRRAGYMAGGVKFGDKRIWGRWRKALTAEVEVPPNLVNFHARAMRFWRTGPGLPFDMLKKIIGDFNEQRMQAWVDCEVAKQRARWQVIAWATGIDESQK